MAKLVIYVECDDPSDLDWLKPRCIGPVQDALEEAVAEDRLDGKVETWWDVLDA